MRKSKIIGLSRAAALLGASLATAFTAAPLKAAAASKSDDNRISQPLVNEELSSDMNRDLEQGQKPGDTVEAPPPAEFPYPGAAEDGYKASTNKEIPGTKKASNDSADSGSGSGSGSGKSVNDSGAAIDSSLESTLEEANSSSSGKSAANASAESMDDASRTPADNGVQQPIKKNADGSYIYSTELKKPVPHPAPGVEKPTKTDARGEYFYTPTDSETKTANGDSPSGADRPMTVSSKGEYVYNIPHKKATTSASVRFGMMTPPTILNSADSNIKFTDIYGKNSIPVVLGDYEWRLTSKIGRLAIKFTSGVATSSGTGQFASYGFEGRPSQYALEKYSFYTFPNQGTLNYRFQYADNQVFVPYIEGGAGYFTFVEMRNDNTTPKFGGAPVIVAAGGGSFLLDWIDKRAIHQLEADYGVSHVWLTAEARQTLGLEKNMNFTSTIYNAGFMMEF